MEAYCVKHDVEETIASTANSKVSTVTCPVCALGELLNTTNCECVPVHARRLEAVLV